VPWPRPFVPFEKGVAQVVVKLSVDGLDFQCALVLLNRFVHPPPLEQDIAEVEAGFGGIRFDFQGFLVMADDSLR